MSHSKQDRLWVDVRIPDALWFIKSLEFFGSCFSSTIPLKFNPNGITVTAQLPDKRKKKVTASLYYKSVDIPKYNFYKDSIDPDTKDDTTIRIPHTDSVPGLSFGVDIATIKDSFGKNTLKPTLEIQIISKPGKCELSYSKDNDPGIHSLKTVVGYTEQDIVVSKFSKIPNAVILLEDFLKMCNNINSRFSTEEVTISAYKNGIRFFVSEYSNKDKNDRYDYGTLDSTTDTVTVEAKFLTNFCGQIDKMCNLRSVVRVHLGKNETGELILALVFKVGNVGNLIYQRNC